MTQLSDIQELQERMVLGWEPPYPAEPQQPAERQTERLQEPRPGRPRYTPGRSRVGSAAIQAAPGPVELRPRRRAAYTQPRTAGSTKKVAEDTSVDQQARLAFGVAGIAISALTWYYGAQFTFDGWIVWLNQILARFRVPMTIASVPVSWWFTMLLIIGVGLIYSKIEMTPPVYYTGRWSFAHMADLHNYQWKSWQACVVWLAIVITDVASTFTGIVQPQTDGWVVSLGAHQGDWRSFVLATVLTFVPERVYRWSRNQLRKRSAP